MYHFQHEPPPEATRQRFTLVRTPTCGRLEGFVTSKQLLGCPTHFWGGRTVPHGNEKCDACDHGMRSIWHGYVSAWLPTRSMHVIFEFTALAAESFVKHRITFGQLRGSHFIATRLGKRANSRVHIRIDHANHTNITLPDPPNLVACLARIWNVPPDDCVVQGHTEGVPDLHVADGQAAQRCVQTALHLAAETTRLPNANRSP